MPRKLVPADLNGPSDDSTDYIEDETQWDDDDEMDEAEMNCGELPEGGCSLAGTEYCDWSCPFSDDVMRRMQQKK